MQAIFTYLLIFASYFCSAVLFFFPSLLTYKQFVVLISVICITDVIYNYIKFSNCRGRVNSAILISGFITFLYVLTSNFYSTTPDEYNTFFLVLIGQSMMVVIHAVVISYRKDVQYSIKLLSPYLSLFLTFFAFFAAFFPDNATSGGYIATESGLNYQTTSYLASYAAAFSLYYICNYNSIKWDKFTRNKMAFLMEIILVCINFLVILVAGGRGGLVMFVIQFLVFLYVLKLKGIKLQRLFLFLILGGCVGGIIITIASTCDFDYSGFNRILEFVQEGDQNGRDDSRNLAMISFLKSPIWGNGVGAIFFELGMYSHNMFTDALVETGILGLLILLFLICYVVKKNNKINTI